MKRLYGAMILIIAISIVCLFAIFHQPVEVASMRPNIFVLEEPIRSVPFTQRLSAYDLHDIKITDGQNVTHGLSYHLMEPFKPYPQGLKFPLVILLHDQRGTAFAGDILARNELRLNHPAFVMVPMLPAGTTWYFPRGTLPQDVSSVLSSQLSKARLMGALLETMVDAVRKSYPVDLSRIYVVGCEMGGVGAFGLAKSRPDLIAAAMPISGGWLPEEAHTFSATPMWIMHADEDSHYGSAFSRTIARRMIEQRQNVLYSEYKGDSRSCESLSTFYPPPMWTWLFSQKKAAPVLAQKNLAVPAKNQVASPP